MKLGEGGDLDLDLDLDWIRGEFADLRNLGT